MPRNSSGTYSLYTPGNPVVTSTVISSSWANNTLSDLATAMTDSLSRSGDGGMLASLELTNGTSSAPGLSWGSDLTSGLYRAGASDFRWVNATVELLQLTTNLMQLSGTAPIFRINESDAAANNKLWDVIASGEDLNFRALTDALAATNWLTVARTAGVIDSVSFPTSTAGSFAVGGAGASGAFAAVRTTATNFNPLVFLADGQASNSRGWGFRIGAAADLQIITTDDNGASSNAALTFTRSGTTVSAINAAQGTLQYGGIEVGYRGFRQRRNFSGADNSAATDAGGIVFYNGTGGHTFTLDTDLPQESLVTIMNGGSGNLTIAGSTSLSWVNGSGTVGTGNRTMAVSGVATVWCTSSGNFTIWGTGLT